MALGMNFDSFGSLCAPVLDLLVSLGIDVELGEEILNIWSPPRKEKNSKPPTGENGVPSERNN